MVKDQIAAADVTTIEGMRRE
eukprot:SAG11_NODE_29657_length_308_cov_1.483254_1_plen_20_part_10